MFKLNFISNPGLQDDESNDSWFIIEEKEEEKKEEVQNEPLEKSNNIITYKRNRIKYFISLLALIGCGYFFINNSFNVNSNLILNNVVDVIVDCEHNRNIQLSSIEFLNDKIEIIIFSNEIREIQSTLNKYYFDELFTYELYNKDGNNYINMTLPWDRKESHNDINQLKTILQSNRFASLVISSENEAKIKLQGKSTDIISFLLFMVDNEQILNYYYMITYDLERNYIISLY